MLSKFTIIMTIKTLISLENYINTIKFRFPIMWEWWRFIIVTYSQWAGCYEKHWYYCYDFILSFPEFVDSSYEMDKMKVIAVQVWSEILTNKAKKKNVQLYSTSMFQAWPIFFLLCFLIKKFQFVTKNSIPLHCFSSKFVL